MSQIFDYITLRIVWCVIHVYRITAVMKVETDVIASITASMIGRAAILVMMYVEIYNIYFIVFIGYVTLTDSLQYQSQFIYLMIRLNEIKGKISKLLIKSYLMIITQQQVVMYLLS